MILKHFALALSLWLLVAPESLARVSGRRQQPQSPSNQTSARSDDERERREALEKKALALLDDAVKEGQALQAPENRARLNAAAADILWDRDQNRARALFKLATDAVIDVRRRTESLAQQSDLESISDYQTRYQRYMTGFQQLWRIRQEVLNLMARHNGRLARDFLTATTLENQVNQSTASQVGLSPEQQIELGLATQLASSDPAEAVKIAEQSLAHGYNYQLPNIVSNLLAKDQDLAGKLTGEILDKLHTDDLTKNTMAGGVALSLLHNLVSNARGAQVNAPQSAASRLDANDKLVSDLMEMVVEAALTPQKRSSSTMTSNEADHDDDDESSIVRLLTDLKPMLPEVQKYAPSQYSSLKSRLDELEKKADPEEKAQQEYQRLLQEGSVGELLAAAGKAPVQQRDSLFTQAANKAAGDGDFERARGIATEQISNQTVRRGVLASINQQELNRTAEEGKLERARPLLSRMTPEARANSLVSFASAATGRGDKKLALQLLDEARESIGAVPSNSLQLQAQLNIIDAYSGLDPQNSFGLLEPLIDQLSVLLSALATLDGFEFAIHFREGELVDQSSSQVVSNLFRCVRSLSTLARSDFDRAKACADRFQRSELRAMTRVQIAGGILSDQANALTTRGVRLSTGQPRQ